MSVLLKSTQEIERLASGGAYLAEALQKVCEAVAPGVTPQELNSIATEALERHGKPAFLGYKGFPAAICVSVNDAVIHGIPTNVGLREGDLVGIDIGLVYEGLITDMAVTISAGEPSDEDETLLRVTKESLHAGIAAIKPGGRIGDIGAAVDAVIQPYGYGNITMFAGHGVGYALHEPPSVPNVGTAGRGTKLRPGMVIAIEPMISLGSGDVVIDDDGWTVRTIDGTRAAHFEHTVAVTETGAKVLTGTVSASGTSNIHTVA